MRDGDGLGWVVAPRAALRVSRRDRDGIRWVNDQTQDRPRGSISLEEVRLASDDAFYPCRLAGH